MAGEWDLTSEQAAEGEWFLWNAQTAADRPDIAEAVAGFRAFDGRNSKAAKDATDWLRTEARLEEACVTRLFVAAGRVVVFYALSSGEVTITSQSKREKMGVTSGTRIGCSHIDWIARDKRAPAGSGDVGIQHAVGIAVRVANEQGNRALTLDPFDAKTESMWLDLGFRKSQTDLIDGMRRLYVPLFGPRYGGLKTKNRS